MCRYWPRSSEAAREGGGDGHNGINISLPIYQNDCAARRLGWHGEIYVRCCARTATQREPESEWAYHGTKNRF